MTSELNKDWRRLLESYIAAYWEDSRRRAEVCLSGSEVRLLGEYGGESLRSGLERSVKARRDLIARSGLPTYEVIEESAHDVIVQVTSRTGWPHGLSTPLQPVRVHLIAPETEWQIADILMACFKCNPSAKGDDLSATSDVAGRATPGKCFLCRGTGTGVLSSREGKCRHCGGTGRCPDCTKEEVPGWVRVFSLDGLKESTERLPPRQ